MTQTTIIAGAGSGIGAATAALLGQRGHRLMLLDTAAGLRDVAAGLRSRLEAAQVEDVRVDVTSESAVKAAVAAALERWGALTGLVNCAATMATGPVTETSLEDWNRVINVNATGTFLLCKYAVRAFLAGEGGSIVNLSSISGSVGLPGQPAYCASKGAVNQLSRQIAVEFGARGVRCNVVSPGSVETPQLRGYLAAQADPAAAEKALIEGHPVRRIATAEEIATTIAFVLSPEAGFINGADVAVDGGYTAA